MKNQLGLFDRKQAREARDAALQTVAAHADDDWMGRARAVLLRLAEVGPFTTDHMWTAIEEPHEPRALGAVIMKLRRAGIIEPTGRWIKSARVACHGRDLREWRKVHR